MVALFLMSCSSCVLFQSEGFMIYRKRNSVGIITSKTILTITKRKFGFSKTSTPTDSVRFSKYLQSGGSGAIVRHNDKTSFILTAAHVCTLAFDAQIKAHFPFYNRDEYKKAFIHLNEIHDVTGKKYPAIPLVWNSQYDICIMVTPKIDQPSLSLALEGPYLGEKVYYMGFPRGLGGGKVVPAFDGYFAGPMSIRMGHRGAVNAYSLSIAPGSSGSSILNIHGDIIGMVHSYYPIFPNLCLSATHKQLKELFEEADKIYEKRKKYLHDELESWL